MTTTHKSMIKVLAQGIFREAGLSSTKVMNKGCPWQREFGGGGYLMLFFRFFEVGRGLLPPLGFLLQRCLPGWGPRDGDFPDPGNGCGTLGALAIGAQNISHNLETIAFD